MAIIACDLTALDAGERRRRAELQDEVQGLVLETQTLSDGYGFRFAPDARTLTRVAEFIALERRCCPFLRIEIEIPPEEGPMWVRITGGPGVKEFLAGWSGETTSGRARPR